MKSNINCIRKNINSNKSINKHRHSSLNLDSNNKILNIILNKDTSSIFKKNKTIQKYINEKLNSLKENKISPRLTNNISTKKNLSFNKIKRNKSIKINNKKKGRNGKHENHLIHNQFKTNEINFKYNDFPKLLDNSRSKSKNNKNKNKKIDAEINELIKYPEKPEKTKGKLIKEFYQNYLSSMSMSTGISLNHNNEIIYKEKKEDKTINSNNYEIDSTEEDNLNMNEIIFKGINKGSPITFGNSFSYTNSKRSSNSQNKEKEENIEKSILLLKNQNESLKHELKESNLQITFLKNEIKKLVEKKKMNITNYKYSVGLKNKKYEIKPTIHHKNDSYVNKLSYDIDKLNFISDVRFNNNKFDNNNNNYYKMKLLKKQKIKKI